MCVQVTDTEVARTLFKCPVCCADDFGRWRFGLEKCRSCGLVFDYRACQPGQDVVLEQEWFGSGAPSRSRWVSLFETLNNRRIWNRLKGYAQPGMHLLEVGVGSGSLLRYFVDRGILAVGCDLSEPIALAAAERFHVTVFTSELAAVTPRQSYKVVVMNHILEHVADPVRFLEDAGARLADGGIVHVAVPNVQSLEARFAGWTGYQPYHALYFDSSTLRTVIEKAGYEVIWMGTHEPFSGWFLTILGSAIPSLRRRKPGMNIDANRSNLVANGYRVTMSLVGCLTWPLRKIQALTMKGEEIVVLARLRD